MHALPSSQNWMCVEDSLSQIQSLFTLNTSDRLATNCWGQQWGDHGKWMHIYIKAFLM